MREITPDLPVRLALAEHAEQQPDGRWRFRKGSSYTYDETKALQITRIGLALDTTPSDIVTSEMFERIVNRIVALEQHPAGAA